MKFFLYLLVFTFILSPLGGSFQQAEKKSTSPTVSGQSVEKRLEFARHLETQNDFYRAITEYKRELFQADSELLKRKCHLGICRSYLSGRKWIALNKAVNDAFTIKGYLTLEHSALIKAQALALWNLGETLKANELLSRLKDDDSDTLRLKGWTAFAAGKQEEASAHFTKVNDSRLAFHSKNYRHKRKSPFLAGTMSAIVPGSGQLYTGQSVSSALGAFLVNALLFTACHEAFDDDQDALGAGLGALALGFYSGNIYGAVNFAKQHNAEKSDDWLARRSDLAGKYKESVIFNLKIPF